MGADLLERFRQAGLEAAGQRRVVTILFVDLSGFTAFSQQMDNEDMYILIQQYLSLLAKNVYKYDGMVDKFMGDGLMAIFGAPIAHENSAELAIRSALDMQTEMAEFSQQAQARLKRDLRLHIGLHTGPVIVGSIGSSMLMNYTAIGDTVNLAYRLEQHCPAGAILASETTYQHTRALFDFVAVAPLALKGISQSVPAFRVLAPKLMPGSTRGIEGLHAPMIGRETELSHLKQAAEKLFEEKKGRLVLIQGEAGIGKTRLTNEFRAALIPGRIRTLVGHSYTYRRSVAYWIFLDLLRSNLGVLPSASEVELHQGLKTRVESLFGEGSAAILPYLEYLFSLKLSDPDAAERLGYLDAAQLRQQIFLAIREVLVAEARRTPLVLIFEDLHWADETSLDLLSFLVDTVRQEPILVLALSRPYQEGALPKIVERARRYLAERFIEIQLKSLTPNQSEKMLLLLLAVPDIPEGLYSQIVQRAAGNPFYLEEIIRMLIDEKLLNQVGDRWDLSPEVSNRVLGVPETLQGLILTRFDRLRETERRILQVAAVVGRSFNAGILSRVLPGLDTKNLQAGMKELEEREFILPEAGAGDTDYIFKHALVSDAIYSTLLKAERSELHTLVGEAIETLYADRLEEQIELLARHFSWGTRQDRALHYLILAGHKAARDFANQQARQHFEAALDLLERVKHTTEQALQVETGLADMLVLAGEYLPAREHYQAALQFLVTVPADSGDTRPRGNAAARASLYRKIGTTYERQGDYDQALTCLGEAQQALDRSAQPAAVDRAWVLNDMGWIHSRRGNLEAAEKNLLDALVLVEESAQYDVIASIYNRLGGLYFQQDRLEPASNYVRKSLVLRQEIGDANAVARSYNNLGLLGWRRGDWDSALENFKRSIELHATLGDVEGTVALHSNLGLLHLDRGDFSEARKHLDLTLLTAQQIGHAYYIGLAYLYLSRYAVLHEEWKSALETCERSGQIFNEIGVTDYLVDLSTNTGLAWLGLGDLDKAHHFAREALGWSTRQLGGESQAGQSEDRGRGLRLLGQVTLAKGDVNTARKALSESGAIFEAVGNELEKGRTACALASLEAVCEDEAATRKALNEARLIFRQLGARADLRKVEAFQKQ